MIPKKLCLASVCTTTVLLLSFNASAQDAEGLCTSNGGIWDEMSCGHYACGQPPTCAGIVPGCNCGPNSLFFDSVGCVESDTCQESNLITVYCELIDTTQPISFESGGDALTNESQAILGQIAEAMAEADWIVQVEVQVHTDSSGSSTFNQQTSSRRAHVVVGHLVDLGVATERLVPHGMGEEYPISSNDTAAGRAMNRRVEFRIVETDDCPLAE